MDRHYFTVPYSGLADSIPSPIKICKTLTDAHNRRLFEYIALWDTGATKTVISKQVINDLQIQPIGEELTHGVSHSEKSKIYIVNICLPCNIIFPNVKVVGGVLDGYDVLIGMDIISKGDFAITHKDKKTKFSFQYPSTHDIDFSEM